jgi:hypothetical protein
MALAVGLSEVNVANKLLDGLTKTGTYPAAGGIYVQLHIGIPGAAGALSPAAASARYLATMGSISGGSVSLSSMASSWTISAGETISHISLWTASTAGTFLWSGALSATKTVSPGDTFALTTLTLAFTPIATT